MKPMATRIEQQKPADSIAEKGGCALTLLITGIALAALYMVDWGLFSDSAPGSTNRLVHDRQLHP